MVLRTCNQELGEKWEVLMHSQPFIATASPGCLSFPKEEPC